MAQCTTKFRCFDWRVQPVGRRVPRSQHGVLGEGPLGSAQVPFVRVGSRTVRYLKEDLEEYVKTRRVAGRKFSE